MKKKGVSLLMAALMGVISLAGCGGQKPETVTGDEVTAVSGQETAGDETGTVSDQEAADNVAALIDAIYVQQRTADTDAQCEEAKAAWDALTEAQKGLVEGQEASPDYFGLDTGDAAKDAPGNQDGIGENELLAVSFGTSYNDSRVDDIKGIEDALQKAYPDWSVRRAFTAQIIINHVQARDGEKIDNMQQALERAAANGVKNLVVQPTHLMHGAEYDELVEAVDAYRDRFASVSIAEPLLGAVGADASVTNEDKAAVAAAVTAAAVEDSGYDSLQAAEEAGTAYVFIGHGTSHTAKVSYSQMQTQMADMGCDNVFIGTVEGEPEETSCEAVLEAVSGKGYKKVILRPLMVVAGDHANNDMAGSEKDSWKSMFLASGKFESVETQIAGLGRIPAIQEIYVSHTAAVLGGQKAVLEDGSYTVDFDTDSSMFHVNEACEGKGTLTVADGQMALHISLPSKNVVNLYPGLAEDAEKDGAKILQPTMDTVAYSDGMTEEVHGFDIPVTVLEEEFDLALLGTKGTWYDHKVRVSNPVKTESDSGAAKSNPAGNMDGDARAGLEDGTYDVDVTLEGGSGRASVFSPAVLLVEGGKACARIEWSSPDYDYMKIGDETYSPVNTEGNSVFEIPVSGFDEKMLVAADTTAMETPHEIEYYLTFHYESIEKSN